MYLLANKAKKKPILLARFVHARIFNVP